jgi:hypothetical protein
MIAIQNESDVLPRALSRPTVAPYTFQQLLDRQVEKLGINVVFHIHVPKASGGTVNVFFRQNGFTVRAPAPGTAFADGPFSTRPSTPSPSPFRI